MTTSSMLPPSPSKVMNQSPPPAPQTQQTTTESDPFANINTVMTTTLPGQKQVQLPQHKKKAPHPSIIKSLLECGDDLVVEGYFCETIGKGEDNGDAEETDVVQATVFSSQRQRKFIVCYRGTVNQHMKPVKIVVKQKEDESSILHNDHPVPVNTTFRDSYFTSRMEEKVFSLVEKLTTENPFCDVVFTGHSFGGALGTIASLRYAALFPMIMVHCMVFGTPKVGGLGFRHLGNSLPNLRVFRVEHGVDYFARLPEGSKWDHVGHTLTINATTPPGESDSHHSPHMSTRKMVDQTESGSKKLMSGNKQPLYALVFRFDERRPLNGIYHKSGKSLPMRASSGSKKTQGKSDHEMRGYVHAVEQFTHNGLPWVTDFVGTEGKGIVSGVDQEERHVV
uniref:Fungal lipase-type domain-containing protein n=1 Tax=Ditylum brightwellii TaxID=49249 RepID=A0A7S4T1U3_9STRA